MTRITLQKYWKFAHNPVSSFLLGLLLLSSCNKNDTAGTKFSWTYDGTTYLAKQHLAYTSGLGAPAIIAGLEPNTVAPG